MPRTTFTVSAVTGGGSKNHNETGLVDNLRITKLKVAPSAAGDSYQIQIYSDDGFTAANKIYDSGAVTGTHEDPVQNDDGTITTFDIPSGEVCTYRDDDATRELHVKVTNNDASARNFSFTVDWEVSIPTTNFTAGSVVFAGTGGALAQDNAGLFWDDGNNRLGIGTASPGARLDVENTTGDALHLNGTGTSNTIARWYDDGSETGAAYSLNGETHFRLRAQGDVYIDGGGASNGDLTVASAGNVGIGTQSPNAKSILHLSSTTLGFLPPSMTTTQRDAISSPPAGLTIYNNTTNKLNFYNGSAWEAVTSA